MKDARQGTATGVTARRAKRFIFSLVFALVTVLVIFPAVASRKARGATHEVGRPVQVGNAQSAAANEHDPATLLQAYRHVEVASVSDAIEQLLGRRMYLSHGMQPLFPSHFAGYAVTVRMEKQENHDPHAVDGMLEAIDRGKKDSVYVMSIEDGADVAGMGGLMGTAMAARDFAGAIIDGAVRDTAYLKKIGFPVYSTGIAPSTLVGHYRCAGSEVPVAIEGVTIRPGDIIAADHDGVVVVPRERAEDILKLAQQLDFKEHSMYPLIEKTRSIEAAVKQFGRL
ncbi:RraA family protein [Occallatibacter riparius]|uniref:Putative 4-hydroxy-4-methyl-2-oxoglutarate aldolase n=1 Tax=Occallatibacter riparius TaxID=1002689 RepID=A0A9J7BRU9_9BACT|nr:RraA family protein [Occallatibacter riparius]UWZ85392.1 RraA family protein [Occallatibacter riparius]